MYCKICGAPLQEDARFCSVCGAGVEAVPGGVPLATDAPLTGEVPAAAESVPTLPTPPAGKRGKIRIAALAAAAAVLVVAVAAAALMLVNADPKTYVAKCMTATLSACFDGEDETGIATVLGTALTGGNRQTLTLRLGDDTTEQMRKILAASYGLTAEELAGSSLSLTAESDMKNRQIALQLTGELDSTEVGTLELFLNDNIFSLRSPDLLGGEAYGFDTLTLGKDLAASPLGQYYYSDIPEDYSINLFDARKDKGTDVLAEESLAELAALYKTYTDAVTVEKGGKARAEVNGQTLSCQTYSMTIPAEALRDLVRGGAACLSRDSVFMDRILSARGPVALLGMGYYYGNTGEMGDEDREAYLADLDEALAYIQDNVTITFYISGGKVVRLEAVGKLENGEDSGLGISLVLQFGNASAMKNALSADLTLRSGEDRVKLSLTSQGEHKLNGGKFSDETVLSLTTNGEEQGRLTARTAYDTKAERDNFSFGITASIYGNQGAGAGVEGTVHADKGAGTLSADLGSIYLKFGDDCSAIALTYGLEPIQALSLRMPESTQMPLEMSPDELTALAARLEADVDAVAQRIYALHPRLRPLDAGAYTQGFLDASFLGTPGDYFLEKSGYSDEEVQALYDQRISDGADVLLIHLGVSNVTPELLERAKEVVGQLYSRSVLTVTSVDEVYNGRWSVNISLQPPELGGALEDIHSAVQSQYDSATERADGDTMGLDAYNATYSSFEERLYLLALDMLDNAIWNAAPAEAEVYSVDVSESYDGTVVQLNERDVDDIGRFLNSAVGYLMIR